jgi:hypothetical protein
MAPLLDRDHAVVVEEASARLRLAQAESEPAQA